MHFKTVSDTDASDASFPEQLRASFEISACRTIRRERDGALIRPHCFLGTSHLREQLRARCPRGLEPLN
ncbi:MAG: hypothetical protein ACRETL_14990, partial [Gammaproteobacteria bacterium]